MIKRLAVLALLLAAAFFSTARAQDNADEQYVIIYSIMQQADTLAGAGDAHRALEGFADAQSELLKFQKIYPDWNPNIVNFRLNYIAEKITELTPQVPVTNAPPQTSADTAPVRAAAPVTPPGADAQAQLDALQQQLQNLQANNTTLEAKLKEALGAQPAAIDSRELDKARDQIRELMKENDLLKVTVAQGHAPGQPVPAAAPAPDTNAIAPLQQALDAANQKLLAEAARADRLTQENETLQARVKQLLASPEAAAALREENALLKKQLAEFKAAAAAPEALAGLQDELAQARAQIALLQSNADVGAFEKVALEGRIAQLQAGGPPQLDAAKSAEYEVKIRDLTKERDDLLAKVDDLNSQLYGAKKQDAVARINDLTDEVNTLRARLAVDEAQPVPYSADELAMFKQPAPLPANPDAEKKSVKELPEGSAELVAEAQNYFAARQFDQAEAAYLKILQHDQNNGLALANLATIELQQGKLADAEKHILAAVAQSPDDAYNLSVLGYVRFQEEKYDDALDALGRAAKLDPQNPEIQNYLGVALSHKGLRQQAETALRNALKLDPNYAAAHNNLAVIYISQNPPLAQLARWHYQKALDAGQPHNPELEKILADKGAPVEQ